MASDSDVSTARSLSMHHNWNSDEDDVFCLCVCNRKNILTGHESKIKIWTEEPLGWSLKESVDLSVKESVTCISQFPCKDAVAVSVNTTVLIYHFTVVDDVVTSLSLKNRFCFSEDEINHVDIHQKGFICTCDDHGDIKVIDLETGRLMHTLTNFHDSICSTVKFSTRKPWELVSGGLDCAIGRWDFNRGRLLAKTSTKNTTSSDLLMVNPPMVHSLDMFSANHSLVCGLGDGRLVVYSLKSPKGIDLVCQVHAHISSVACVRCIELKRSSSSSGASVAASMYVISVGNDAVMCVHKLNCSVKVFNLVLVGKVCLLAKVNCLDLFLCGDSVFIFTADVTGSVSIHRFVTS